MVTNVARKINKVPKISLYAICRVKAQKTMRIVSRLGRMVVTILVDSKSTHNFMSSTVAKKLDLIPTN